MTVYVQDMNGGRPSRPRNTSPSEPAWGERIRGQVNGGTSGDQVWLNCYQIGLGVTVRMDPDEADALADRLHEWAQQARTGR